MDAQPPHGLLLDVVQLVVGIQGRFTGIHFRMDGGEHMAGAVVVNQQVVNAQHPLVG